MKDLIVMTPTCERARHCWRTFSAKYSPVIKKANGREFSVELLNGMKIYFRGETEGGRTLKGLRGKFVSIDEFELTMSRK